MLPTFDFGPFRFSTFRLFMLAGLILGVLLFRRGLARRATGSAWIAWPIGLVAGVAGIFGARLYGAVEAGDLASLWRDPLTIGAGGSWIGGFVVAGLAALATWRLLPVRPPFLCLADAAGPAAAFGLAALRLGCFVAGDGCYGVPTRRPWGIAYPRGADPTWLRVHPTELYEAAALAVLGALLLRLGRRPWPPGRLAALYLAAACAIRFAVEFWRRSLPSAVGLTPAQGFALAGVAVAALVFVSTRNHSLHEEVFS